jgi:hypothetical protein
MGKTLLLLLHGHARIPRFGLRFQHVLAVLLTFQIVTLSASVALVTLPAIDTLVAPLAVFAVVANPGKMTAPGNFAILISMMTSDSEERLFRLSTMRNLFSEMGRIAQDRQQTLEIAIYGGSALALCFDWRTSTADIDYMPVRGAEADIQEIAGIAARNLGLPEDGLRSDVQIFASDFAEIVQNGEYPAGMPDGFGLRVFTANPEYLLSMKMLSMRSSLETQDCRDVWHLIDEVGVKSADEALNYITRFYPNQQVPIRNVRILEDIFEAKQRGENYSATLGW